MTITPETIELLKRLEAAATLGEWRVTGVNLRALVRNAREEIVATRHCADSDDNEHDMAFIAAARNHLREVIEGYENSEHRNMLADGIIKELRAKCGEVQAELASLRTQLADARAEIEQLKTGIQFAEKRIPAVCDRCMGAIHRPHTCGAPNY